MCHRFNNDYCFNAFMCRANLHSFFFSISFYIVFSSDMIDSACCFVKKTIKSRKFSGRPLRRLWLIFWNCCFETTFRVISIFWILLRDFLIRAFLKNVLLLNSVSVAVILFWSSLIFFFCFNFSWIVRVKRMPLFLSEVRLPSSLNRWKTSHSDEALFQKHALMIL